MKSENKEIFIPGPSGRIQAKYIKNKQQGAPVALVLQPHPQYGGTMNNRIVYEAYNCFYKNGFSVIKINFRGVEKSDGVFDNGQGELSDAAAALDWAAVRKDVIELMHKSDPRWPSDYGNYGPLVSSVNIFFLARRNFSLLPSPTRTAHSRARWTRSAREAPATSIKIPRASVNSWSYFI